MLLNQIKNIFSEEKSGSYAVMKENQLVVFLDNGVHPVVWRTSFDDIKSALFTVEKKGKNYILTMNTHFGAKTDKIASFDKPELAHEAHILLSEALSGKSSAISNKGGWFQNSVIFLVFFIVLYIGLEALFFSSDDNKEPIISTVTEQVEINKENKKGVPLSLDELIK